MAFNPVHVLTYMQIVGQTEKQIRETAVALVDLRHGYTAENAPNPEAHRAEYDETERWIRDEVARRLRV